MKQLVKNKQIEFVNGGWVDNDEAAPNFDDIINNNDDTIHPILNLINQTNCQQHFDSDYIQSLQDMHFFYSYVSIDDALRNQNLLAQRMRQVIG